MGGEDRVSVIIPWASDAGCRHREAALAWVVSRWEETGHQVVIGEHTGPWSKALAVEDGLTRASGDILIIADADVWTPGTEQALAAIRAGALWAIPHRMVRRLAPAPTLLVLAGEDPAQRMVLDRAAYVGLAGGGMVALPRTLCDQVPLDPRFVGWGQEDESWATALRRLAGRGWRGVAPLWHLWHPPPERASRRWGSPGSRLLADQYRRARTAEQMRALLNEIHQTA